MTDPDALAREARRTLAGARTATLLVEGLGRTHEPAHVLLDDHDGHPRFACPAGSAIATAAAARCPAILDVEPWTRDTLCIGSVIFAGYLATDPSAAGVPADLAVVELQLVSVVVEIDDPQSQSVVARQVPLNVYRGRDEPAAARGSELARAAETMRVHTNAWHAERLRACAAARAGVPDGDIIEARLVDVAPDGAVLQWLDADGGHVAPMRFPRAAADRRQLADALRVQLCARGGRS